MVQMQRESHSLPSDGNLNLEGVLVVLRRRWWLIVLFTVLVGAASFVFSEHQVKQYTATASALFENPQLSQQESGLQVTPTSPTADPAIMATNVRLLTQQSGVAADTARIVGHGLTALSVSQSITVSQQGQTSIVDVSATSRIPSLAAMIANTYVARFISSQEAEQRASVTQALSLVQRQAAALSRQQLAGTGGQALLDRAESLRILANLQDGGARVVTPAKVPTAPSSPKVARNTVLGLVLGLLLGLMIAFLLERLDRRMKNVEDLEATYQLPLLAAVPHSKSYAFAPQDRASSEQHGHQEVFRLLRAYLTYFNVDKQLRSLLVTSAAPGDGKTTIARNLAQAAQEAGTKTLLLEADLRRPDLARHYSVSPDPGLSELLVGRADVHEAIRSIPIATRINGATSEVSLDVLPAGHPPPNPAELIESIAMGDMLSWAISHYELVVIDTPPLAVVSDAVPLLRQVDGVIVVSRLGRNTRDAAAFFRGRLLNVNAPLLGVVANGVKAKRANGYGYSYGYYGADGQTLEKKQKATVSEARPDASAK
jgi:capsular exopolysaccharide synthesis family protein